MGEIKDIIQLYIDESDLIPKQLGLIAGNLEKNIKDELQPGHGFLKGDLFRSIQAYVDNYGGANGISTITGESNTHYAKWVNEGHPQEPGRFIPGYWSGNEFKYTPGAKEGMVLKEPYVEGYHFMENGLEKTVAMYK